MYDGFYFGPGPTTLPDSVKQKISDGIQSTLCNGAGILELSHRNDFFLSYIRDTEKKLRILLDVPADYTVLFMPSGARFQYNAICENISQPMAIYAYGYWSTLLGSWTKEQCKVYESQSALEKDMNTYAFLHTVSNETVDGICLQHPCLAGDKKVIIDATSDLCLRPIPISSYACVYAATQKALGIAGMSVVIASKKFLAACKPSYQVLSYNAYAQSQSLHVTPAVFTWWVCGLMIDWMLAAGGLDKLHDILHHRSHNLRNILSLSSCYSMPTTDHHASLQNVCFNLVPGKLKQNFFQEAASIGLYGLQGHKNGLDVRVNLYHNVTDRAYDALCTFLMDFNKKYG